MEHCALKWGWSDVLEMAWKRYYLPGCRHHDEKAAAPLARVRLYESLYEMEVVCTARSSAYCIERKERLQ